MLIACLAVLLVGQAPATRYAGDFELLGTSARATGMGGAAVAVADDASAIYYNPSRCVGLGRFSAAFLHSSDFSGLVRHNYLGVAFGSRTQSIGVAVLHNGIPGIKLTALPDPTRPPGENNRPYVTKTVSANQFVGYVSIGRALNPYLALGGNVKVIYHDISVGTCFGMGLDLGATVTPVAGLVLGVRLRNASTSPLFWTGGTREYVEPTAALGLARTFTLGRDRLTLAIESEAGFEPSFRLPGYGLEYSFRNVLLGRLGAYQGNLAFGLGLRFGRFRVDYGYASGVAPDARELGSPQQLSGGIQF
ncbi:MAG: hypothetical protein ABIK37_06980 [candidate division WOR-3 bacterium]